MRLRVEPAGQPLQGHYCPPGDKSISHRLAILGGLADGETRVTGYLDSDDTRATLEAMQALGAEVGREDGVIVIRGGRLEAPESPLDLGNSGTGMRLLCGALAGRPELIGQRLVLVGDASLSRRPMARIVDPLTLMGARIDAQDGHAPLTLTPSRLAGAHHRTSVASAQVKSALLLAGLCADGETVVLEPDLSRDHTERLLPAFGVEVTTSEAGVAVRGGKRLQGGVFHVPGDLSSAAFIIAAALLVDGSSVTLENVGLNPTRDGVLRVVEGMGAGLVVEPADSVGSEPVGRIGVRSQDLSGIDVPAEWVSRSIDEFPVIMALAAASKGPTRIRGAAELRVKESDRIAVMCRQLSKLGVDVTEKPDGAIIRGGRIDGGRVDCHGDHRIAMSLAVLGLVAVDAVEIDSADWIRTSYPAFTDDLASLGADLSWRK
jgi:3-phosphoshikimate 1-carboxyvinyltransferase